MSDLSNAFGASGTEGSGTKIDKIIALTEKMDRIQRAINAIRYDDDLFQAVPDIVVTLGAAKDACMAELKTL